MQKRENMSIRKRTWRSRLGFWWWVFAPLLVVLVAMFVVVELEKSNSGPAKDTASQETETKTEDFDEVLGIDEAKDEELAKIDLQEVVDAWAKSVSGNKSVMIYDLDREEIIGEYNAKENYSTASLYKLFVVYEGYRRVQFGEWDGEAKAGTTDKTILKCLDLAIRESNSSCAETLWMMIGHDELDEIIERDFDIKNSEISKLISNATDVLKMLKIFYQHSEISDETLLGAMWDSFLNQPTTTYNWRQGLPSGFSEDAKVYNKVGWEYDAEKERWNIYHDAAIVEFGQSGRHLAIVVMTNYIDYKDIAKLGAMIEAEVNKY